MQWARASVSSATATSLGSIGAGLRYLAAPRQGVMLGLDYAEGRDSDAWFGYIGDAF